MAIMREAVLKSDWERMEKGLPPVPKKVRVRVDPEWPEIPNRKTFADIPPGEVLDDLGRCWSNKKNKDGVSFIGYDVYLRFKSEKVLQGWMAEVDWLKVVRSIPAERTDLIDKASK